MNVPADNSRPLNIAHRGARSLAPENTLAAARKALETGADMWELDVGMTADGELIVIHDATLDRTSDAAFVYPDRHSRDVRTFTLEELRRLDFGSWFVDTDPFGQAAAGAISPEELQSYAGEPVPTLREALLFTRDRGWRVNVEIKDLSWSEGEAGLAARVAALVEELDMADRVVLSSFNHTYLERVREAAPRIVTGVLASEPVQNPESLLRGLGASAFHPRVSTLGPEGIARLRDLGFGVHVWTVNETEEMEALIRAGVSGLFTDFPQVLKVLLDARAPLSRNRG